MILSLKMTSKMSGRKSCAGGSSVLLLGRTIHHILRLIFGDACPIGEFYVDFMQEVAT